MTRKQEGQEEDVLGLEAILDFKIKPEKRTLLWLVLVSFLWLLLLLDVVSPAAEAYVSLEDCQRQDDLGLIVIEEIEFDEGECKKLALGALERSEVVGFFLWLHGV